MDTARNLASWQRQHLRPEPGLSVTPTSLRSAKCLGEGSGGDSSSPLRGPSHLDTFDTKPQAPEEIRGSFRPIRTKVPGIHICEHFPRTAPVADKLVIIRSTHHTSSNHPAASYWMMTGHPIARPAPQFATLSREDRPHLGSVLAAFFRSRRREMPAYVTVPELISPVGPARPGQHAGFLGAAYDPYRVESGPNLPEYSPGELRLAADLHLARLETRRKILDVVNQQACALDQTKNVSAIDPYLLQVFDLVSSPAAQSAFDITQEPASVCDRYGRHTFGQSVLLARRLIEAGVRLVQVNSVRDTRTVQVARVSLVIATIWRGAKANCFLPLMRPSLLFWRTWKRAACFEKR